MRNELKSSRRRSLSKQAIGRRAIRLAAAVGSMTSLASPVLGAGSVYIGPGGTAAQPADGGNFSSGANWFGGNAPTGSATLELDFSSSGGTYTATDDTGGALQLNSLQLNLDQATAGGTINIVASGGSSLTFTGTNPLLYQNGSAALNLGVPVSLGATLTIGGQTQKVGSSSGNITIGGALSGAGGLTVGGSNTSLFPAAGTNGGYNTVTVSGANTYAGATALNGGTLSLDFTTDTSAKISSAGLTLGGGTLNLIGNASTVVSQATGGTTLNGGATITITNGAGVTLDLGAINRSLGGTLDVSNNGTVNTSTLNTSYTGGSQSILGGWATFNGGRTFAVTSNTAGSNAITGLATGSYSTTFTSATNVDAPAGASGPAAITINSLRFDAAAGSTVTSTGALTIASGGLLMTPNAGAVTITGSTIAAGNATTDLVIHQYSTANALTLSSAIAGTTANGSIALVKDGPGTVILGTANTFTGDVLISGGVLQTAGGTGNATTGPFGILSGTQGTAFKRVTLMNGATLRISTATNYNDNVPGATVQGQIYYFGAGGGKFDVATAGSAFILDDGTTTGTGTVAGSIGAELQGFGDLTKVGAGVLSLGNGTTNFSNYTGQININAGSIVIGVPTTAGTNLFALGSTSAPTVMNAGGTLEINGQNIGAEPLVMNGGTFTNSGNAAGQGAANQGTVAAMASGPITLNSGVTNSMGGSGTGGLTLSGVISGPGGFSKVGTGQLTLSGPNTYTGTTTVSAGTLLANNATALGTGPVTVAGGTLNVANGISLNSGTITINTGTLADGAAATIVNAVTSGSGAHNIAPGGLIIAGVGQPGALTIGTLTLNSNANLRFDLSTPAGNNDSVTVSGSNAFTFSGTGKATITLDTIPTAPGNYNLINYNGTSPGTGVFQLAAGSGAPTGGSRITYTLADVGTAIQLQVGGSNAPITATWVGTAAADNWTDATKWDTNPLVPGLPGDTVRFDTSIGNTNTVVSLVNAQKVGALTFNNSAGTGTYTLAAGANGALFFDNNGGVATVTSSVNNNTISAPITLANNTAVAVSSGNTLTLSGVITGSGTLTHNGPGTLLLGVANTYTSQTIVNSGGTLKVGNATALGTTAGNTLVNSGGALDLNGLSVGEPLVLNGSGISGGGALINSSATAATASGTVNFASATTIGSTTGQITLSGVLSGSSLIKNGSGLVILTSTGNGSWAGGLQVVGGTSRVQFTIGGTAANTSTVLGTGQILLDNGGTLTNASGATATHNTPLLIGSGGGVLDNSVAQKWQFSTTGGITGSGTLTRMASNNGTSLANNVSMTVANTGFTGAVILTGGVTEVSTNALGTGLAPTNTLTLSGGEIAVNITTFPNPVTINSGVLGGDNGTSTTNSIFSGPITVAGNFNIRLGDFYRATSQNLTISGPISGTGTFTLLSKNATAAGVGNSEILTLTGDNSGYTSAISLPNAGYVLVAGQANALGSTAAGTTIASGSTLDIQAALSAEPLTVGGTGVGATGAVRNSSAINASHGGTIALTADTTVGVSGTGDLALNGVISGGFSLSKIGAGTGTLFLGGVNTFGGAGKSVTVSAGTLAYSADTNLGDPANSLSIAAATVRYNGATSNLTRAVALSGGAAVLDVTSAGTVLTHNNAAGITGTGGLTKTGAGTLALATPAGSLYSGGTTLSNGTLQVANTSNSATGTGAVTLTNGVLSSPAVTGGGSGTATGIISGATTVNATTGSVIIAPGGIDTTADTTGLFVGNLTFGALTTNNKTTLNFDLDGGPGASTNDLIHITTGLTVGSNTKITFDINPSAAGTYQLMTVDSGTPNLVNFVLPTAPAGTTYQLSQSGTAINLLVNSASTASDVWTGAASDGDWNNVGNWQGGTPPNGVGASATLGAAGTGGTVNLNGPKTLSTLNLATAGSTNYTVASGTPANSSLTFDGGGAAINVTSGQHTISAPVVLNTTTTVAIPSAAADSLTISGAVSGVGGLSKSGPGTAIVSGQSTFTGSGTITGGTLQFTNTSTGSANNLAGASFTVATGAKLQASAGGAAGGSSAITGATVTLNGGTLQLDPTANISAQGLTGRFYSTTAITGSSQADYNGAPTAAVVQAITNNGGTGPNFIATWTSTALPPGPVGTTTGTTQTNFMAQFLGRVNIPTAGAQAFSLKSDDGSRLFIDGVLIIGNDGSQGGSAIISASPTLSAGLHDIRLDYYQGTGGATVTFTGPNNATFYTTNQSATQTQAAFQPDLQLGSSLVVANSSTINLNGTAFTSAGMGSLTSGSGQTLTITGTAGKSLRFTNTVLTGGTFTFSNTPDVAVGQLSDSGVPNTITKTGTGRLIFDNTSSANTLGSTTIDIQAGTVVAIGGTTANSGTNNPLGTATVQLNGGTLMLDTKVGSVTFDNNITIGAATTNGIIEVVPGLVTTTIGSVGKSINIPAAKTLTINTDAAFSGGVTDITIASIPASITGGGALVKNDVTIGASGGTKILGTLVLSGTNSYTGGTTISSGTLQGNTLSLQGAITDNATLTFDQTFSGNFTGAITGTGAVIKQNTGTVTFTGTNSWSGATTVSNGVLNFGGASTGGATTLQLGNNASGGTAGSLNLSGSSATAFTNTALNVLTDNTGTNVLTIGPAQTLTINGNIQVGANVNASAKTNLLATGGGQLKATGTAITFTAGLATTSTNANAAVADFSGLSTFSFTATTTNSGTFRVGDTSTLSSGLVSSVILAPTSTIQANTLGVGDNDGSGAQQKLTLGSLSNTIRANTINIGSVTTTDQRASGVIQFPAGSTGSLTVRSQANATGTANLTMINTTSITGTQLKADLLLAGHNADVSLNALVMAKRNAASGTPFGADATITFDNGSFTALSTLMTDRSGAVVGTPDSTSTITVGGGTMSLGALSMASITSVDATASPGKALATININGGAVSATTINMANAVATGVSKTATSAININGGSFTVSGNITRSNGGGTENATINVAGGTFDVGTKTIGTAAAPITVNLQSGGLANLANLNGGAAITKTTAGALTITGTNAYPGATSVNAGTLTVGAGATLSGTSGVTVASNATFVLNGTISSAMASGLNVASGGTFKGSGSITNAAAAVTVNGTMSPGNSPGTMTLAGPLSLASGSTYVAEIGGTTPGNGTNNYDQTTSSGLTIGGNLSVVDFNGFANPDTNQLYFLLVNSLPSPDQSTNPVIGTFNGLPEGATVTLTDGVSTGQITYTADSIGGTGPTTGNDVALYNVNLVPEPASIGLLGLGAVGLLARRRRRRG